MFARLRMRLAAWWRARGPVRRRDRRRGAGTDRRESRDIATGERQRRRRVGVGRRDRGRRARSWHRGRLRRLFVRRIRDARLSGAVRLHGFGPRHAREQQEPPVAVSAATNQPRARTRDHARVERPLPTARPACMLAPSSPAQHFAQSLRYMATRHNDFARFVVIPSLIAVGPGHAGRARRRLDPERVGPERQHEADRGVDALAPFELGVGGHDLRIAVGTGRDPLADAADLGVVRPRRQVADEQALVLPFGGADRVARTAPRRTAEGRSARCSSGAHAVRPRCRSRPAAS